MPKDTHTNLVRTEIQNDPRFAVYLQSPGALDAIMNAYDTGDWSAVPGATGKPFDPVQANKAFADSMAVLDPVYAQERLKDTQDLTGNLEAKKAGYQNYLNTSASNFQQDKTTQDQNAADQGVLFSGGRVQKLNNLATKYEQDAALKKLQYGADVAGSARDYQYKYGNDAAKNSSLSQYYKAGTNTYNPNVATGGVGAGGIKSIYNPGAADFYGTNRAAQSTAAKIRAAGLLAGKTNKLVSGSYNNQL